MFLFFETCFAKGEFYFNVIMSWELLLLRIFYAMYLKNINNRVGKSEIGIGETGIGETGIGETGTTRIFISLKKFFENFSNFHKTWTKIEQVNNNSRASGAAQIMLNVSTFWGKTMKKTCSLKKIHNLR